jgi:hypothetical protein
VALISITEGGMPVSCLLFKFLQLPVPAITELRRGDSPRAFPYPLVSCASADKNA